MEGDSPLDEVNNIARVCAVPYTGPGNLDPKVEVMGDGYVFTAKVLDDHQDEIAKMALETDFEPHITYQVWAYLVMKHGAVMTMPMKSLFLNACNEDTFAQSSQERAEKVKEFQKCIESYDGKPIDPGQNGSLFDSLEAYSRSRLVARNTESNCRDLAAHIVSGWNFEMLEEFARSALALSYRTDPEAFNSDLEMADELFELSDEADLKNLLNTLLNDDHGVSFEGYNEIIKWLHSNKFSSLADQINAEVDATNGRFYLPKSSKGR